MFQHGRRKASLITDSRRTAFGSSIRLRGGITTGEESVCNFSKLRLEIIRRCFHEWGVFSRSKVSLLELWGRENALEHAGKVAAISQVLQPSETCPKDWSKLLSALGRHREIPLQVLFNLHFREALFGLLLLGYVDSPVCQVRRKVWVNSLFVAFVAENIGRAFGCDGAEFHRNFVGRAVGVGKRMRITS